MKAFTEVRRREFLRTTTGAVGLAAVFGGFTRMNSVGAESAAGRTPKTAEAINSLLAEMEGKGRQFLSVPRKDGQFLNLLVKATRAKSVLEVGTSHGYSALWFALGLEESGGHLTTIEIDPERVKLAKAHLTQAGLTHRVTFKEGDAHRIVTTLDGPFDFVFLDADKEGQVDYFNKLFPGKLAPGGILAVHNAIHAREAMKEFLDLIQKHPDFDSMVLSVTMNDGFSVSYRHRA